jgi:hypothetical protein
VDIMTAANLEAGDHGCGEVQSAAGRRAHCRAHPLRYRLAVVAATAADVVRHVGGWLCDRTMAGWEVTVLLADTSDVRPLRILGATAVDLEGALSTPVHDTWPHALAVAPDLFVADRRVRQGVLESLDRGLMEVALWDGELPAELDSRLELVEHRLSVAARAFKRVALTEAGAPLSDIGVVEAFRCGELLLTGLWGGSDLVAAR